MDVPLDEFNRQGDLTNIGKNSFWREVDRAMKKFDLGDIKLLPRIFGKTDAANTTVSHITDKPQPKSSLSFMQKVTDEYHHRSRSAHHHKPRSRTPVACKRLWPATSPVHLHAKLPKLKEGTKNPTTEDIIIITTIDISHFNPMFPMFPCLSHYVVILSLTDSVCFSCIPMLYTKMLIYNCS